MESTVLPDGTLPARLANDASTRWIYDLYRIGQSVARVPARDVRQHILEHIIQGFSAASGCLAATGPEPERLTIVAAVNLPAQVLGRVLKFGERILGRVAAAREPLLLNGDLSDDPRLDGDPHPGNRPASALCWPLVVERRLLGAVTINRTADREPFGPADLEEGRHLVNAIALAVDNARLHAARAERIAELARVNAELADANHALEMAHAQLVQREKLASIGQLAAGVAHEINNPVGYVNSNVTTMRGYLDGMFRLIRAYEEAEAALAADSAALDAVARVKREVKLDYLKDDARSLLDECGEGLERVKRIVQDLRDFAHAGEGEWEWADLHKGLDSTLNIVHNEVKYKAEVVRQYGDLPRVECLPGQVNQVFMNLLVNAAQAIEAHGTITVRTGARGDEVWVEVADTGAGIPEANLAHLFDPFFTTKPVGHGTGLGLSLSYGIVDRHRGRIEVDSRVGEGTTFRVTLPVRHAAAPEAHPTAMP